MLVRRISCAGLFACVAVAATIAWAKGPVYTDPAATDDDFPIQGEYVGRNGDIKRGAQIIALGEGDFDVVIFEGGLPGDGWDGKSKKTMKAKRSGQSVQVGDSAIQNGKWQGPEGTEFQKVQRKSPTLGKQAPADAVVLFDGKSADSFAKGQMTDDGLLMQGCTSKQKFGSHNLHIEFRLPYRPQDRGQARGNSGLYMQGRYEIQMLDSFGLEGKQNECGGIYSVAAPQLNMCFPPLSWQTYDIQFSAAKYSADGKLIANPRMTVLHNGVCIHDDQELPGERNTTAAPVKAGPEPGPVYLQDHGNPVRYRNIWVVETD